MKSFKYGLSIYGRYDLATRHFLVMHGDDVTARLECLLTGLTPEDVKSPSFYNFKLVVNKNGQLTLLLIK